MAFNDQLDIVTFDEVIDLVLASAAEGRTVGLHIEAKWPGYFSSVGLDMVDPILTALEKTSIKGAGVPVFIQCFEPQFLAALSEKSDLPRIQNMVGPPYAAMMGLDYKLEDMVRTTGVGAEKSMVVNKDGTASDFVNRTHAMGLVVHVYTVRDDRPGEGFADSQAELHALIEAGVDGIWVDYPGTAVAVFGAP